MGPNAPDIVRGIPIFARVQSKAVTACWQRQDFGTIRANQICQFLSDGTLTTYDPTTGCTLPGGKWYSGTLTSASCPAGTVLPDNASLANCQGATGAGFEDNFPEVAVPYTNGTIQTMKRPPVDLRLVGKSCQCSWAVDLDPASLAGAKCQILCVTP